MRRLYAVDQSINGPGWRVTAVGSKPQGSLLAFVDFYHAREHLKRAFDLAYGENSSKSKAQFEKYRHLLRDERTGVEKVIRALCHVSSTHPRKKKLSTELRYFRRHRHRMRYAEAQAQNLPIGSGVVEAACKTLATQRLKRSGMRWRHHGGQAILTLPAFQQSERFATQAWTLLSGTYKRTVATPDNVMLFPKRAGHYPISVRHPFNFNLSTSDRSTIGAGRCDDLLRERRIDLHPFLCKRRFGNKRSRA